MAEIKKLHSGAVGRVLQHNRRIQNDGVTHANKQIDNERTCDNYEITSGNIIIPNKRMVKEDGINRYTERLSQIYHMNRANLVTMCDVIVTLPQDVLEDDEQFFFQSVYDFYKEDFRENNIVSAVVHKDEMTPHIHLDFVPAMKLQQQEASEELIRRVAHFNERNGLQTDETLNAFLLLNRRYFQTMHVRLSEFMEKRLGYPCEILNGATANGNKTVLELKNESLRREVENQRKELHNLQKNINTVMLQLDGLHINREYFSSVEILNKMSYLSKENEMLRDVVSEHNIEIPPKRIEQVISLDNSLKNRFNYRLNEFSFRGDGTILIETFKEKERILPNQVKIEQIPELVDILNDYPPKELTPFFANDTEYLLFPTDSIEDTLHNLLLLKENEHNIEKLILPSISNDTFGIAEQILRQCQFETDYYIREKEKDTHELYRNLVKE